MNDNPYERDVPKAAVWLDFNRPAWFELVPRDFNMSDFNNCVGFWVNGQTRECWLRLQDECVDAIRIERVFSGGDAMWRREIELRHKLTGTTWPGPSSINVERYNRAKQIVDAYAGTTGYDDTHTLLSDLVSDVLHVANADGLDAESVLDRALRSFQGDAEDGPYFTLGAADDGVS